MNAAPRSFVAMTGEAMIVGAEVVAGHDGAADLVVSLQYDNGVVAPVTLDAEIGFSLMKSCGVASVADLAGHSWRKILEGL
jgi:hypothetical protein